VVYNEKSTSILKETEVLTQDSFNKKIM
jgi:hypothetical protein